MKLSLTKKMIVNISTHLQIRSNIAKQITLQRHHVYSTLKWLRNDVEYNRDVFVGVRPLNKVD